MTEADGNSAPLAGQRILIVEDEMLLAMDLEGVLESWGAQILGPVPSIAKALDVLAEDRPDLATLDINLSGESSRSLAGELKARDIPFVLISGYSDAVSDDDTFKNASFVRKPYDERELLGAMEKLLS